MDKDSENTNPTPKAIAGGIGAGVAALVIWSAIAFIGGIELGFFAIIVGVAVGAGVRLLAKPKQGLDFGVIAVLIALTVIVVGKLAATTFVTESQKRGVLAQKVEFTDDQMMIEEARPIINQLIRVGAPIQWRNGKSLLSATSIDDFPPDIAQKAKDQWNKVSDKERAKQDAVAKEREVQFGRVSAVRQNALSESFSILNLLWIVLALPAAFFLGAGTLSLGEGGEELDGGVGRGDAKWSGDTLKAHDAD